MSDYPLATLNPQFYELEGEKYGMVFDCPNCGVPGGSLVASMKFKSKAQLRAGGE